MGKKEVKKKINLLGNPGVGKTSLVLRYVKDIFGEEYLKTIGTNIYKKVIHFQDLDVKLIIHDIMGEKAFDSVREGAFKGSTGAIAVADITRPETLDKLPENWLTEYRKLSSGSNPVILAVNKNDLEDKKITEKELEDYSEEFEEIKFTSAKHGDNVEYIFKNLASRVASILTLQVEDIDYILSKKDIKETMDFLDALLAVSSELGNISSNAREELLLESGIDKFELHDEEYKIDEDSVYSFAKDLKNWYEEDGDEYSRSVIEKVIEKYESK